MVTLLAMDTSTKATGYAVYKNCKLKKYGMLKANDKDSQKRMGNMVTEIYRLFDTVNPDIVIVETPSMVRNPKTQRELTMIVGAVFGKSVDGMKGYFDLRPTEWRKLVKDEDEKLPRKREELKLWGIRKVEDEYGFEVAEDTAEAILIGQAYINLIKRETS